MDLEIVGNNIRRERKKQNISQQELAESVGYKGKDMISRIESGQVNIPMDKLKTIADVLSVHVSDLMEEYKRTAENVSEMDIKIAKTISELPEAEKQRILNYLEVIRSTTWLHQSGMENAGDTGSHKTE